MNKLAVFLKIKQESLASEIKLIKKEMRKYKYDYNAAYVLDSSREREKSVVFDGISSHLYSVVRVENRAANIARAYLRGYPYNRVESSIKKNKFVTWIVKNEHNVEFYSSYDIKVWNRVVEIIRKYQNNETYYGVKQRPLNVVEQEVFSWRNAHPQLKPKTRPTESKENVIQP